MPSRELSFPVFDADNHMYEPQEALTKYLPEKRKNVIDYVQVRGRTKIVVRGHISEYIPNPTFEKVAKPGAQMLDAPVSGSVVTLEQGKLSMMIGGDRQTFERVSPILHDIAPTLNYVGTNGQAVLMKIAVNLSLAVQMLAFSEGVLLAEKSGIARDVAVDVLVNSAVASPMIKYRGPFVLQQPEEAWFDVNMMQKDMVLAMELGRQLDVPLPTTAVSNEILTAARGMGWTKYDFACMFDVLAAMSGVSTPVTTGGKK